MMMVDDIGKLPVADNGLVVRRLVEQTGITDLQAVELIGFLGPNNWSSLLREARILRRQVN